MGMLTARILQHIVTVTDYKLFCVDCYLKLFFLLQKQRTSTKDHFPYSQWSTYCHTMNMSKSMDMTEKPHKGIKSRNVELGLHYSICNYSVNVLCTVVQVQVEQKPRKKCHFLK